VNFEWTTEKQSIESRNQLIESRKQIQ